MVSVRRVQDTRKGQTFTLYEQLAESMTKRVVVSFAGKIEVSWLAPQENISDSLTRDGHAQLSASAMRAESSRIIFQRSLSMLLRDKHMHVKPFPP